MNDAQAPRKVSVEVPLYPLRGHCITPLDAFIDRVKQVDRVEGRCTDLSTQVCGDYELVMDLLRDRIAESWDAFGDGAVVLKVLPGDLRGIAPDSNPDPRACPPASGADALVTEVLLSARDQLLASSGLELAAAVLAVLYLALVIRENIWCWYAAFVSTSIFLVIFWQVRLYMESGLQVFQSLIHI